MSRRSVARLLAFVALMALFVTAVAGGAEAKRVVTVMTRNMDAGTDLNLIFALYPDIPKGVSATIAEVISSDIPGRVTRLADEIRTSHPDFIALQEVTQWRTGPCGSTTLLYDQLDLLLAALAARNMNYTTLAVDTLATIEAPALTGCVGFKDRNAILVSAELRPGDIEAGNIRSEHYAAYLDVSKVGIQGIPPVYFGYISADVTAGEQTFRLVNTHLASTYAFDPNGALQALQAAELMQTLSQTPLPIVLAGDFNSNADVGPEQTPSVGIILQAGLTDVWAEFNPPGTGYTWPLFYEDLASGPAVPNERIDLIFTRGVRALKVDETGLKAPWASDHAGVAASLQIGK